MRGAVLVVLAVTVLGCARSAEAPAMVRVLAAASLAEAMTDVAAARSAAGEDAVVLQLGGSRDLARQIAAGAPADLFVAADERSVDELESDGLLAAGTRRDLLSNRLVVIVPASGAAPAISAAADLAAPGVRRLALAHPRAVPAGVYARGWLERRGLWESLRARVVAADNVRAALAMVASGNADAGIVYATDAGSSAAVRVALAVPAGEAPRIVYPGAVLAGAANPAGARRLLDFLASEEGLELFTRRGFAPPPGADRPHS